MESPTFSWRVALKISSASYPDITLKRGLLERSGAKLGFSNGIGSDDIGGAIVSVNWPSKKLVVDAPAFGKNELIEV